MEFEGIRQETEKFRQRPFNIFSKNDFLFGTFLLYSELAAKGHHLPSWDSELGQSIRFLEGVRDGTVFTFDRYDVFQQQSVLFAPSEEVLVQIINSLDYVLEKDKETFGLELGRADIPYLLSLLSKLDPENPVLNS